MNAPVGRGAVIVLLVLSAACEGSVPTSPTGTNPSLTPIVTLPSPAQTPPSFPPLSGPARTFVFERADHRVAEYTEKSRFVLYDNGAFALQYPTLGGQYRGSYKEENGLITFAWADYGSGATGRLDGNSLKVEYVVMMQMSDFEDAVYARTLVMHALSSGRAHPMRHPRP